MRPQARPERPVNVWAGLLGLIGYAVVFVPILVGAIALLLAMQPARP